jgi:hypothetical protein
MELKCYYGWGWLYALKWLLARAGVILLKIARNKNTNAGEKV